MEPTFKNMVKFFFNKKNKTISWTIIFIVLSFLIIRYIFIGLADIDPFEYFRF